MKWLLLVSGITALLFTVPLDARGADCNTCPADFNCDGVVDQVDLDILLACWGTPPTGACACADLNGDGTIDGVDLGILLGSWGPCP